MPFWVVWIAMPCKAIAGTFFSDSDRKDFWKTSQKLFEKFSLRFFA
jgi:hypothetical protein